MNNFTESGENRKEEILAKNRQAKKDEGLENAKLKGNRLGEYTMSAVGIPLVIYSFVAGEIATFWAVGAIVFAFVLGQSLTVYRFTRRKYHLAWVILGVAGTIYFLVQFAAETQGWWETQLQLFWWQR
ncbi:MAG: DUF6442 family protein [Defluviitaleaceae bacterium]|nr:DUF6442 family protein [Defluviitaleaceae bacterium]